MEDNGNVDNDQASIHRVVTTIFLIDAREEMFSPVSGDDESVTKFKLILDCCKNYAESLIKLRNDELISVVLFGTGKDNEQVESKYTTEIVSLGLPSVDSIKTLEMIKGYKHKDIEDIYGEADKDNFSIANELWKCCSICKKNSAKMGEKRILLFTDDDEPHNTISSNQADMARKRALDLKNLGVTLQVFPMGETMDYNKFYKELCLLANGEGNTHVVCNIRHKEDLEPLLMEVMVNGRRFVQLKLDVGKDLVVGVSLCYLFSEEKVPPSQTLEKSTNEPVKSVRQTFDEVTGELLLPSEVNEFIRMGGDELVLTSEEKSALHKLMEPGLTLLGFKNAADFDESLHCGNTTYLYPEEKLIVGSSSLVKTLVRNCFEMKKVALCAMTTRVGAHARYVCLYPVEDGKSGFHLVALPSEDMVRDIPLPEPVAVEQDKVELATKVVKKLTKKGGFHISDFTNPKIEVLWETLKALALEEEMQEVVDSTEPDLDSQTTALGSLATEFASAFGLNKTPSTSKPKRPSTPRTSGQPKWPKYDREHCIDDPDFSDNIKKAIKDRKVERYTCDQLRQFLILHNVTGYNLKKAELVEKVYKLEF